MLQMVAAMPALWLLQQQLRAAPGCARLWMCGRVKSLWWAAACDTSVIGRASSCDRSNSLNASIDLAGFV
jgi:hypothetical protein